MSANVVKAINPSQSSSSNQQNSIKTISGRQSKELVIAFCGAIGAGIKSTKEIARVELAELGYEIVNIRISKLMDQFVKIDETLLDKSENHSTDIAYNRYIEYQKLGDKLRKVYSPQIMAEAAIHEIAITKEDAKLTLKKEGKNDSEIAKILENKKIAYFIDQLKNPAEVELFRLIYQNNFYLIGVFRSESERKRNLREERIERPNVDDLVHKDRKSANGQGQQTEKTILDADVFIRNCQSHVSMLKTSLRRFFNLIHGVNGITPSLDEKGMFSAFSASLQSACLSRQVGAAIVDGSGNLIATGKNDVPKAFGGLYSTEDSDKDYRCIHKGGKCYNDAYKLKIKDKIIQVLSDNGIKNSEDLGHILYKNTGVASILEFSRSIHAEMDAITSIARLGNSATQGSILYTTTYPCHNCARHIVAAGITKAIYIEPYEKSLALDLHDDAITNDKDQEKVRFEPFEGISPRRYAKFFFPSSERKDDLGLAIKITTKYNHHVDIQFLDSSSTFEDKISQDFVGKVYPE